MNISKTSVDLSPKRKPVQLSEPFHRKLEIMATEQHRGIGDQAELLIEQAWQMTHPQPISISEYLERG